MKPDPATAPRPAGRYMVTVTFNEGTSEREVHTNLPRQDYEIFLFALSDMRMSSGPGLTGKVLCWNVRELVEITAKA